MRNILIRTMYLTRIITLLSLPFLTIGAAESDAVTKFSLNVSSRSGQIALHGENLPRGCNAYVYGATKESLLDSSNGRKVKVLGIETTRKGFTGRTIITPAAKRKGIIFLQARSTCRGEVYESNVKSLRVKADTNATAENSLEFLKELRSSYIKSLTEVTQQFSQSSFTVPVDFKVSKNDDRYFIVEQAGYIRTLKPGNSTPELLLDATSKLVYGGERGLLGLAIDPNFPERPYIFVNYSRKADGATIIARYTVPKSGKIDLATEKVFLTVPQPFRNHNGGGLTFGPDENLYIALGDGGSRGDPQGNGQNKSVLLGKILRIDVSKGGSYSIPKGNPFRGNKNGYKEEIYAYGLRNPWKISFDRNTLWAADVGQNLYEEVDIIVKGGNYGWDAKEADHCFEMNPCEDPSFIDPINEYGRDVGMSVTGGYVSRDLNSPNLLGVYIFGDYVTGRIFALERVAGEWKRTEISDTENFISSFGKGHKGEVYMLSYGDGKIFKIKQT